MIFQPKTRPKGGERRNLVVLVIAKPLQFPGNSVPFFIFESKDIEAVELAMGDTREIFIVPPKLKGKGLENLGTYAKLVQTIKMPDGYVRVLIEAIHRAKVVRYANQSQHLRAEVEILETTFDLNPNLTALMQITFQLLMDAKDIQKKIPQDKWEHVIKAQTPDALIDSVTPYLNLDYEKKLEIYLETRTKERLEEFLVSLRLEIELSQINYEINRRVRQRLDKSQKEHYLQEKIREMQRELGDDEDPTGARNLRAKIEQLTMNQETKEKCLKESDRLQRLQPTSAEAAILRTYLEWITDLPWNKFSIDRNSLHEAQRVLDEDHYNMRKVKDRILDFLATRLLQGSFQRGPILCLVGPPGTGKTSLARSVARALNRNFVRISLGGVRDEAEIRGHRKTYVGALPGRIIQGMKRAKTSNPVFLLDEIDKLSSDYKGDPAAALLEVLDPEINSDFSDHYLEVPYDLSHVFFITTANSLHTMSRPLVDRLEVIEVPGYTVLEKIRIAEDFLIPKQKTENGLEDWKVEFTKEAIRDLIERYTSESGVRSLERNIAQVLRRSTRVRLTQSEHNDQAFEVEQAQDTQAKVEQVQGEHAKVEQAQDEQELAENKQINQPFGNDQKVLSIGKDEVRQALGVPPIDPFAHLPQLLPGIAIGLAWTENGGRVLPVEVSLYPGKGELVLTGSLGDVMKESARIALSYIKAHHQQLSVLPEVWQAKDIHIHFPEGAIPKDGPSAGLAMVSALVSAFLDRPLRSKTAMTGEVTLVGKVLPIGGLKEKLLAAHRQKLSRVILPADNQPNLEDIPEEITSSLTIHWVNQIEEALKILFMEEDDEQSALRTISSEIA